MSKQEARYVLGFTEGSVIWGKLEWGLWHSSHSLTLKEAKKRFRYWDKQRVRPVIYKLVPILKGKNL